MFTANFNFLSIIRSSIHIIITIMLILSVSFVYAIDVEPRVKQKESKEEDEKNNDKLKKSVKSKPVKSGANDRPILPEKSNIVSEEGWDNLVGGSISVGKKKMISLYTPDGTKKNQTFMAFYSKQNLLTERGTIVILHDRESHPDWKNVIRPLRTKLPNTGWNTLSIQAPILDKPIKKYEDLEKFYQSAFDRINGAIFFLNDQKAKNVMIVAYGTSAMTALSYLSVQTKLTSLKLPVAAVSAFAMISPYSIEEEKYIEQELKSLERIRIPILDIYGGNDLDIVKRFAKERHNIAKRSGNRRYLQQKIENADHFYLNQSDTLVKRVHSFFMAVIFPSFKLKRPLGEYLFEIRP